MSSITLPKPTTATASLSAVIKFTAQSSSAVQCGERIGCVTYFPCDANAVTAADANVNGGATTTAVTVEAAETSNDSSTCVSRSNIRARMKKRWNANTCSTSTSSTNHSHPPPPQSNSQTIELRAPSSGVLHIHHSTIPNAVQYTDDGRIVVSNIEVASIEPCDHPALVGNLCAVCGVDTRSFHDILPPVDSLDATRNMEEERQARTILRREHCAVVRARDDSSSVDASVNASEQTQSQQANTKDSRPNTDTTDNTTTSTTSKSVRSLSSLLSGAKTTQDMQQNTNRSTRPSSRYPKPGQTSHSTTNHHTTHHNTTTTTTSNDTSTSNDSTHTKMTVSGGITLTISSSEAKSIAEQDAKKLKESQMLCLVLDLDHTLLHATDDVRAGRFVADHIVVEEDNDASQMEVDDDGVAPIGKSDETSIKTKLLQPNPLKRNDVRSILLPSELSPQQYHAYIHRQQQQSSEHQYVLPPIPHQKLLHFVKLRPHLKEFFSAIQSTYKLSVYTAGTRAYAERIAVMICRHLVGATLDEGGLMELRGRVRELDEEWRRYRNWRERREMIRLAEVRDGDLGSGGCGDNDGGGNAKIKGVSLAVANGDETRDEGSKEKDVVSTALKRKAVSFSDMKDDKDAIDVNATAETVHGSLHVSSETSDDNADEPAKQSANGHIPRKKRKVESDSLISLIAPPPAAPPKSNEPRDPSKERDALRKQLEEAEALEVEATSLRRKLFGSRIVSRTDVGDLGADVKSLKRVFPCGGVMAAIVDDREDVWANAKNNDSGKPGEPPDNLLLVRPYHWKPFSGYRDVNNASGEDLSKTDDDKRNNQESDEDGKDEQLLWIADILKRLHQRFYSPTLSDKERDELSVPSLLRSMRRETLSQSPQANVVFSGVIPIQQQNVQTKVRLPMVRYAEELGAKILPDVTQDVTHVVARRDHSDKIKRARADVPGCYIVYPSWLMECYWSITKRDVEPHHMGPLPAQQRKTESSTYTTLLHGDSEEEEELEDEGADDDFLDDLESEMLGAN